jgi:GTP-binding protein HflX
MAHPDRDAQKEDVESVLAQLGAGPDDEGAPPLIEAWNKVDLLSGEERNALIAEAKRRDDVIPLSALTGWNIEELRDVIAEKLRSGAQLHRVQIPVSDGSKIAWLHARGDVVGQRTDADEVHIDVRLSPENWARFQALQSA